MKIFIVLVVCLLLVGCASKDAIEPEYELELDIGGDVGEVPENATTLTDSAGNTFMVWGNATS